MTKFKYSLRQKVLLGEIKATILERRTYPDKNVNEYLIVYQGRVTWIKEDKLKEDEKSIPTES